MCHLPMFPYYNGRHSYSHVATGESVGRALTMFGIELKEERGQRASILHGPSLCSAPRALCESKLRHSLPSSLPLAPSRLAMDGADAGAAGANAFAAAAAAVVAAGGGNAGQRIRQLKAQQDQLKNQQKELAKAVKNEARKRKRLMDAASKLSNDDLAEVFGLRAEAKAKAKAKAAAKAKAKAAAAHAAAPAAGAAAAEEEDEEEEEAPDGEEAEEEAAAAGAN